jgi:hypothetical protein
MGVASYGGVLTDHPTLIRTDLAAHEGTEIDTAGDRFFAAFLSPSACVATMVEGQRALGAHPYLGGPAGSRADERSFR